MQRFKNILVVVNDEGVSDVVLDRARWLANANDARLTLLRVRESGVFDVDWLSKALPGKAASELNEQVDAALHDDMEAVASQLRDDGADVSTVMAEGVGFIETIRQVLTNDHDLVIKGAAISFDWNTLGGPDLHLLRKCPCPVWILKSGGVEPSARRIMAAVDPDPDDDIRDALNQKVMQLATSLAVQDSADLDVLNAWYLYEEHLLRGPRCRMPADEIEALLEQTRQKSRWQLDTLTSDYVTVSPDMNVLHIKGMAADVIAHHAEEQRIDTLVMGTVGRTGLAGMFIGNTAETVLNRVKCSVLAVKPQDFVSPVRL